MDGYLARVVDAELDEIVRGLPATSIEGVKGVGKTETALRRARSVLPLDDPRERALLEADPGRLTRLPRPVVVDEWQRYPPVWDLVRRAVDRDRSPGQFILTGSATPPAGVGIHSGVGRIVRLRMRPMTLAERQLTEPTVSLAALLAGERPPVEGQSVVDLRQYADEITASGYPGVRAAGSARLRTIALDGYLDAIADREFPELGHIVRRPQTLRAWLRAYAAATATTTSYAKILDAATPGSTEKPAKTTTIAYRDTLARLWLLEPVPGWSPSRGPLARITQAPKHHLADPALAARLLGLTPSALLTVDHGEAQPSASLPLGALFESLVTLCVAVYAQRSTARVYHLRTEKGLHEVDLILERDDGRVLAIEVKLSPIVGDTEVKHLRWLRAQIGDDLLDAMVVTTGGVAYRRSQDGIAVVPAALLGP